MLHTIIHPGPARKILIVDDDADVRRLFCHALREEYAVRAATDGRSALKAARLWAPDLVLLDILMPGLDGYETCRRLKSSLANPPQIIMVSAKSAADELTRAFQAGADDYLIKPVDIAELRSRIALHSRLLESRAATRALQCELDDHHLQLKQRAAEWTAQITAVQDVTVFTLAKVAESRDNETGEHVARLREYAQILAKELSREGPYASQIDDAFLADLYRSSPLHDIGKVGIPDSILLKPGRLTEEEFEIMKRHTSIGGNILQDAVLQLNHSGFLAMAALIAHFHHERWDGLGYPAGLVAEEIPLAARIVAVADVYDALTSKRPYKEAWTPARAREMIDAKAGTQFDPVIVAAFDRCLDAFDEVRRMHESRTPLTLGAMSFARHGESDSAEYSADLPCSLRLMAQLAN